MYLKHAGCDKRSCYIVSFSERRSIKLKLRKLIVNTMLIEETDLYSVFSGYRVCICSHFK